MTAPIGYFVHHQGRGHAERAAAIAAALPPDRPITLFTARADIFPALPPQARVVTIPSLFEPPAAPPVGFAKDRTPDTLHCAPLGWSTITEAVATIAAWFDSARPALFVTDVSAELGQLARIASVPHVAVLQHGDRADPGHMAAYEGAIGILAPYHPSLEQPGRPDWMTAKTHYAPGVGIDADMPDRATARAVLGLPADAEIVLAVGGGGGGGTPVTPLTLGARAEPDSLWITIGEVQHDWHATPPANLRHMGWVANPEHWIAAADRIVSSAGNTTVHMIAAAGRPWIVVPEWRYFDEQLWKARMLGAASAAVTLDHWPSHGLAWRHAWQAARACDPTRQRDLVDPDAAAGAAAWLDRLARWRDVEPAASILVAEPIA
ncbi:hypothetical protein ACFSC3_01005 [Sphingomonas floccifaciens]|uniref:Glycosyl transferase family 28 C-terminal domain-containing protein n=1 Tax=Sphingomonas floccifaciens TaxID=1844115 RepID=A0ABW4NBN9_9SPHN